MIVFIFNSRFCLGGEGGVSFVYGPGGGFDLLGVFLLSFRDLSIRHVGGGGRISGVTSEVFVFVLVMGRKTFFFLFSMIQPTVDLAALPFACGPSLFYFSRHEESVVVFFFFGSMAKQLYPASETSYDHLGGQL